MEINKQLFEDVLAGKLKGTFVLKNKQIVKSNTLKRSSIDNFPYEILINYGNGVTDYGIYKSNGDFESYSTSYFDIIDFIPDTNMKESELTIEIPEGQEIDWQESAKQEKIIFKRKDTKPRSWKEYLELNAGFDGAGIDWNMSGGAQTTGLHHKGKAIVPTYLAQPFIAMMQLMSVRQEWIGDWEPNYYMNMASNWGIEYGPNPGVFSIENHCRTNGGGLTFPTKEMATDFMDCFKDLLNVAKPLI